MEANNVEEIREALSDAVGLLESILEAFSEGTGGVYVSDMAEAIDNARAALAATSRNCDRFGGETEAMVAFLNEEWLISVKDLKECPFYEWTPLMKERYAKWLLAPSMEQKGEPYEQK